MLSGRSLRLPTGLLILATCTDVSRNPAEERRSKRSGKGEDGDFKELLEPFPAQRLKIGSLGFVGMESSKKLL